MEQQLLGPATEESPSEPLGCNQELIAGGDDGGSCQRPMQSSTPCAAGTTPLLDIQSCSRQPASYGATTAAPGMEETCMSPTVVEHQLGSQQPPPSAMNNSSITWLGGQPSPHSGVVHEPTESHGPFSPMADAGSPAAVQQALALQHRSVSRASSIASSRGSSRVGAARLTFVRSTDKQPGLNTGDVIMFLAPGGQQVYAVAQHVPVEGPGPSSTANVSHASSSRSRRAGRHAGSSKGSAMLAALQSPVQFVLHMVDEDEVTNSRGSCFLEVVRQVRIVGHHVLCLLCLEHR